MCDCCSIKENRRLTEELINANKYIAELELKIKKPLKQEKKEELEEIEELFDVKVFDFDLE